MNSRFRKGMAILVTLTFLMQYVIFTSPAMLTVYADTDGQAVETVIDDAAGTEDAASDAAAGDETADPLPEQPAEEQEDVLDGENNEPVIETEEAQAAPAAEEEKEIAAPAADTKAAEQAPSSGTQYLAFTSDIHNSSNNTAANRLDGWFDEIIDEFGHVDYIGFCGDMGAGSATESQFWTYTDAVKRVVDNEGDEGIHGFYTTGNHEYYNGEFKTTSNATKGIYTVSAEDSYTAEANYRVYALGTTHDWNSPSDDQYEQSQIDDLEEYLTAQDTTKPIIILSHFPLHRFGSGYNARQTANANKVIAVLNEAAAAGKTIVFLWGHNHSVSDTFYDEIYGPGDTIPYSSSDSAQIQFYYAAAGCMSDQDYGSGSAFVKGKGLVIQIRDDDGDGNVAAEDLGFAYYNAGGTNVTENKDEFPIVVNPVAVESISIDEASSGGEAGQPMEDVTVEIGRTTTLHATVLPADATSRTVTWSSSDTSKATVDPSTGKVKGVAEGSVTITASVTDAVTGETFTADIGITVVPRTSSDPDYVITIDGYALSTEESPNQAQGGTSSYTYDGLSGVAYTSGEVAADNIRWIFEETDGG
ncbi:MAG: Ig-like domain-containing protein, partial [Clostridiales bacterium]|nr:Ig-like domain-containing protein [Clostridiales bacterium]